MTTREKVLAGGAIAAIVICGGGLLAHVFVVEPLATVRAQLKSARENLATKQNELAKERQQIGAILAVNPRLAQWDKISLPPRDPELKKAGVTLEEQKRKHLSQIQVKYELFLSDMMRAAGFRTDSITVTPRQPDRRTTPPLKGKEPMFERLAFAVTGKGSLDAVTRAMREFHKAPLLHQVRSVNLDLVTRDGRNTVPEGTLELNMTVEALMVAGAEERTALLSTKTVGRPTVLAEPMRDYNRMTVWNMFTGYKPYVPTKEKPVTPTKEKPKYTGDKPENVLRWVKVTMIWYNQDRKRWEASLYDQAKGGSEIYVNTGVSNELTIKDKDRYTILDAKIVRIDEEQVILKAENKFYRGRCGDFLYPAIDKPLGRGELEELGLKADPEPKEKPKEKTKDEEKTKDQDKTKKEKEKEDKTEDEDA